MYLNMRCILYYLEVKVISHLKAILFSLYFKENRQVQDLEETNAV